MVRPTMVCARSWRMAATVELSTPPLMATATVFALLIAAAPGVDSSCVSDDNCLVLFVCEFCETISKATSTAAVPLRATAAIKFKSKFKTKSRRNAGATQTGPRDRCVCVERRERAETFDCLRDYRDYLVNLCGRRGAAEAEAQAAAGFVGREADGH